MDLVCFSHLGWDFVYQRPQHLLSRFNTQYQVYYIQEFSRSDIEDGYSIKRSPEGVYVISPHLQHGGHGDHIARQRSVVNMIFDNEKITDYICWYYTPMSFLYSDHLFPSLIIYDCMDELSAFKFADPGLKDAGQYLLKKAAIVFTGGNSLYRAKMQDHHNIHSFPSSIDKQHFSAARNGLPEFPDQQNIPYPRLGFFGVVDERFDIDLIDRAATLRPEWQFIIIGPVVKIDPAILPRRANIHYLGSKTYNELPVYLSNWDIALIPFAINESTQFISPTKTPEYLAAGKPVISTPIADVIDPYGTNQLVHIAHNADELVAKSTVELLTVDKKEWLKRVDDNLSNNSWDKTWSRMFELIKKELAKKQNFINQKITAHV